jgi:hypothetical protein
MKQYNKHGTNYTKHSKYKYTYYQDTLTHTHTHTHTQTHTHTLQNKLKQTHYKIYPNIIVTI